MKKVVSNINGVFALILLGFIATMSTIFVLDFSVVEMGRSPALWLIAGFGSYSFVLLYWQLQLRLQMLQSNLSSTPSIRNKELSSPCEQNNVISVESEERNQYQKGIELLASFDHLTGLSNRSLLLDRLQQAMVRSPWNNRMIALMFVNLDRFKTINDTFGHDTGDILLKQVGNRLLSLIRDGDTVARLEGDEFAIGLIDIANKDDVTCIVNKITQTLDRPFTIDGRKICVSASIGISMHPNDCDNVTTLLQHADIAMRHAKDQQDHNFQYYNDHIGTPAWQRIDLQRDLTHALERDEFRIFYQPRVDLETGDVRGMEALIRWQHPTQGLISPDNFIPQLEKSGLIVPVGSWILHSACKQNKIWQDAGFGSLRVSVNVSARQFIQHNLVADIKSALAESGLDGNQLELEITESLLLGHMEEAMVTLQQIHDLNVKISLDDFGTGFSSLGYLKRFPISTLKIDRSFIHNLMSNPNDAALTKAVIAMARYLNLDVTAEGVELTEQVEFLSKYHCDELQGFLFSKPIPANQFTSLLEETPHYDLGNNMYLSRKESA